MKSYRRKDTKKEILWHRIEKQLKELEKTKQMMTEMAMPLKAYIRKIEYYMYELIQNWCLCKWCQQYDPANVNFNHWMKELRSCINQLKDPILKSKPKLEFGIL